MAFSRTWTRAFWAAPASLPFSFVYDGQQFQGLPEGLAPHRHRAPHRREYHREGIRGGRSAHRLGDTV